MKGKITIHFREDLDMNEDSLVVEDKFSFFVSKQLILGSQIIVNTPSVIAN